MFANNFGKKEQNISLEEKNFDENRFPTNGLKTLLKNSELLEVLLKPLNKNEKNEVDNGLTESNDTQIDLGLSFDKESSSKSLFDWENEENLLQSKLSFSKFKYLYITSFKK